MEYDVLIRYEPQVIIMFMLFHKTVYKTICIIQHKSLCVL